MTEKAQAWTCLQHLPLKPVPDQSFSQMRRSQQTIEIKACFDAHLVKHVNHVFGTDIADRVRSKRAPSQAADTAFKAGNPLLQGDQNAYQPQSAGIMDVEGRVDIRHLVSQCLGKRLNMARCGHASRVAEGYSRNAKLLNIACQLDHSLDRNIAFERAAESNGKRNIDADPRG